MKPISHTQLSVLFLLPALISALTASSSSGTDGAVEVTYNDQRGIPTKDAPVDGKDGKPHLGPFVDTAGASAGGAQDLPPLKGRPDDYTVVDGKRIPKTNDGVMFDKNRDRPQEGTTGTEGGVSERSKKLQGGNTGERIQAQPESPKEPPPLPHSEEEKIRAAKEASSGSEGGDPAGLDKPEHLPDFIGQKPPPLPHSAQKDHLEVPSRADASKSQIADEEGDEGIIQPFHSFILSLTMILVSEVGDKTFLVAALMAMKHDRMVVFSAAFGALLVMTVLSAVLGHAVPSLIPRRLTSFLAAGLFFVFGIRLLREGMEMDPNEGVGAEMSEVEQELAAKEKELGREADPYSLEMGMNGGRQSRSKGRFPSPARSPSQSPMRHSGMGSLKGGLQGISNLCSLLLSPAWVQTFVMTFLGEWGDRSQIATIAMAAGQDYWWVTLGACFGHAICTGAAVIGGRAIAGRVSMKVVTIGGAAAFLIFGVIYFIEAIWG